MRLHNLLLEYRINNVRKKISGSGLAQFDEIKKLHYLAHFKLNLNLMQCFRANRGQSSASSKTLSIESLNSFLGRHSNRKSFIRRSFDLVRKSVVGRNVNVSRRSLNMEKSLDQHFGDHNNNLHSSANTYDGDISIFSTDCDIVKSNTKRLKQQFSKER